MEKIIEEAILETIDIMKNEKNLDKRDIYNEFSFQHELGIKLREKLKNTNYNVQFERNVKFFNKKFKSIKTEIDICIYNEKKNDNYAIELKYILGKNQAIPRNMYNFIKDVKFMQDVLKLQNFKATYCVTVVDETRYYDDSKKQTGIYGIFRKGIKKDIKIYSDDIIFDPIMGDSKFKKVIPEYAKEIKKVLNSENYLEKIKEIINNYKGNQEFEDFKDKNSISLNKKISFQWLDINEKEKYYIVKIQKTYSQIET